MKFIKSYKIFESSNLELDKELVKYKITNYVINEDGSIDVNDNVNLDEKKLNKIPFKFNKANESFYVYTNQLTSLKNCPNYVKNTFSCSENKLISLEFGPEFVGGSYFCNSNRLKSLKGCIDEINGDFDCDSNFLTSLEFCPMQVEGDFICSHNLLTELDRSPFVRGKLYCAGIFKTKPEFNGYCGEMVWKY